MGQSVVAVSFIPPRHAGAGCSELLFGLRYLAAGRRGSPSPVTAALESVGVTLHISEFKERNRECRNCGAQWVGHEEKETDVRMSIGIVADALTDKFDLAIVVTADSDMKPAVARVRNISGKNLLLVAPPKRFAQARALQPNIAMTPDASLNTCCLVKSAAADR